MEATIDATKDGMVAGGIATAAMSVPMLLAQRRGSMGTQPPERVVEEAEVRMGAGPSERGENVAASVAHLAFGMGTGASFALVRRAAGLAVPGVVQGTAFALLVWAVSYAGWLPRLGILPPPDDDRSGRQRTMVLGHVVFGAVLGGVEERLAERG